MMTETIAARFLRDIGPRTYPGDRQATRGHEMTVLHDDGLYRHLLCKSPDCSGYWFELITAPGSLTFRGDGESFVFARERDMFGFFRGSSPTGGARRPYGTNPYYWSEKITDGGRQRVMRYDSEKFVQVLKENAAEAIRCGAPRGMSRAVRELLELTDIEDEHEARRALYGFEYGGGWKVSCACGASATVSDIPATVAWRTTHRLSVRDVLTHPFAFSETPVAGFMFSDTWEWGFSDYDWWFLWACEAIVWAIAAYDDLKTAAATSAAQEPTRWSWRSAFRRQAATAKAGA